MSTKTTTSRSEGDAAVAAALAALEILDVETVDRCPSADCPLCGPALPIAA
ncbi:MAG: hypothetical protein HZA58_04385 [Acidimicrobiia bacterium]|nr:hypothetical protein [Acidimicrobiia bacterium]